MPLYVQLIYGMAGLGSIGGDAFFQDAMNLLEKHNVKTLDTGQFYGGSGRLLGEHGAGQRFTIDTKVGGGFMPGTVKQDAVIKHASESLAAIRNAQVDVYYIHAPDRNVPLKDTLGAINQVYRKVRFRRSGLSKFCLKKCRRSMTFGKYSIESS